ncbi:hypothetical protein ACFQV4_30630 [Streptomyces thermocarboxydus]
MLPCPGAVVDAAVLHQNPGRTARVRAAQWALRPTPLALSAALLSALRLAALALAVHSTAGVGGVSSILSPTSAGSRLNSWRTSSTNWSAPVS